MQKKIHNILLGISVLPALLVMPAFAATPNITDNVFVLGDIVLDDQHVAVGEAAFAGRRMDNWVDGKYQNVFPKYKMVARSFDMSNSDTYVGPVILTVRELTGADALTFNYQDDVAGDWTDLNLASIVPGLTWNVSEEYVVAAGIPQPTAGTIALFAHLDGDAAGAHAAGLLSFKNTKATIDGATINASTISVTNGSVLTFVKQDTTLLNTSNRFFTNVEDIDSDGVTTLNADTINIANSSLQTKTGAKAVFNAADMATLTNITMQESSGVFENQNKMTINHSSFTSNSAAVNGGAIYNVGNLTFAGTNAFRGNTANGVANDIHNLGALTFDAGSVTTMDGGVTGTGTLSVADGATLNLGTGSIVQKNMILDGTVNADLKGVDEFAFFDVSDSFDGSGTLNLSIYNVGEYNVFHGTEFDNRKINVTVSSVLFDWNWNDDFDTITAKMKSVEDIAADNGLTNEAAQTVANLVNSSSEKLNDLADAMQDSLESGDAESVEQAHAAIHPEKESVVQTVAMSVQNTVANLASNRLMALNIGRNGGDVNVTGGGVWAQGIYNKTKQNDAFRGYTRGVAGGVDMTLNRALTLGAGYSYAHSDISGTARNTEIDSSTIFAYGQYKPTNWFMHAVANYTMSDYSEHAVALGTAIDATYDVHSYGGQLMTGYDFAGGITPSVGVRYMHISADEYKNSLGIKNKLADSDYMTAILETKWTYGFKMNKHLMLRPELRYAVKYDVMSDEQIATVLLPGVDSYVMSGNRLSRIAGEFGGGLSVKFNGLDLSVNYEIELREGFTSQTGRARVRYEF